MFKTIKQTGTKTNSYWTCFISVLAGQASTSTMVRVFFSDSGLFKVGGQTAVAGDIDNDKDLDLVLGSGLSESDHLVYLNNGNGVLTGFQGLSGNDVETIKLFDADGDGDLDLFVGDYLRGDQTGST